jgi:hypothetical protein
MDQTRKKISDIITGAYLKSGLDIKSICGATGLPDETFRRAVSFGIIDLADLIKLCPSIGLDLTEIASSLTGENTPKWQNPHRVKPAEDLYFFFRLKGDTEDDSKRIGHYDAAGYACEKDGLNHQWYLVTSWREMAEDELSALTETSSREASSETQQPEMPDACYDQYPG